MTPIISRTKWLNPVTYTNSSRPHKIVQVNVLHVIYDILVIEIFEVKVVYKIYPQWVIIKALRYKKLDFKCEFLTKSLKLFILLIIVVFILSCKILKKRPKKFFNWSNLCLKDLAEKPINSDLFQIALLFLWLFEQIP